jgi:GT2 family glycosyltransferase
MAIAAAPRESERVYSRIRVAGKFLADGGEKVYLRGVTYGTFGPGPGGEPLPAPGVVESDFARMAANGLNALRLYTVPPPWLLDAAGRAGLRVLAGIPWEQHVAFLDDRRRARDIEQRVRAAAAACAGHPALLALAIGNEIPPSIVRWAGRRRIERHLRRLRDVVKAEDPEALVTYGNFPSTEYLDLDFLDFACFNVYLEEPERLERYLARLQNLAGDRPLVLGEIGLDSRRHGEHGQARSLYEQVRTAFAAGCAGAFVFAWTDEWHRSGHAVSDWDFGLTTRQREAKAALPLVRRAFARVPFPTASRWPPVSVVVCVRDGAATLDDCLAGVARLEYPDFEVLVVDDGSVDDSAAIAARHRCRVIRTPNQGLSAARNLGIAAARGEIVAFVDADARPDPHWLHYLADAFAHGEFVGVGGPNLPYPGDGEVAECVAQAPGGPIHVLLSDREAEHIPGCNMAFRRSALEQIGGFDPQFRAAGDDVDLCWRLQERGGRLGFAAAAVVWHHQRDSVRGYWRQQLGYGRAEALLEAKWPEKYNAAGQVTWSGRIYAAPLLYALRATSRVYHGIWGTAPFQPRHLEAGLLTALAAAPEWYLIVVALAALALLGIAWPPLALATPLLMLAVAVSLWRAGRGALGARFPTPAGRWVDARRRARTAWLFLAQPAARLSGRWLRAGRPVDGRRRHGSSERLLPPRPRQVRIWSERGCETAGWLSNLERELRAAGAVVSRGGPYDRWDLEVRTGTVAVARLRMCIEDHGGGRQLLRFGLWPWLRVANLGWLLAAGFAVGPAALALAAAFDGAWGVAGGLAGVAVAFAVRAGRDAGAAMTQIAASLAREGGPERILLAGPERRGWRGEPAAESGRG